MKRTLYRLGRRFKTAEHWLIAKVVVALLSILRRLPPERAFALAESVARHAGPWVGRHRVAVNNLTKAYPEKSEAEIEAIASDMWANMARLAVEYVFLDKLFDFDPESDRPGRVEVSGVEIFKRIRDEKGKPHIFFTAHLGNFEFLPIAAATFEMRTTSLFRPPNNPYVAEYIMNTRRSIMGGLVPSLSGAAMQLARELEAGGNVGVLVDQKFRRGVQTEFFGRKCRTNPLLPKLARQYECDVYPARCIRLPDGRYRLELQEKIDLPRNEDGVIDISASAQMLNDIVEGWVRETPGQWMWFHKRWAGK